YPAHRGAPSSEVRRQTGPRGFANQATVHPNPFSSNPRTSSAKLLGGLPKFRLLLRVLENCIAVECMAGHATRAHLPCVRAAHMILPLRAALLAATIGPEVVEALTNCRAGRIAGRGGRRDDVTPNPRALRKAGVPRQEVLVIE